jgi:hypothetical protein
MNGNAASKRTTIAVGIMTAICGSVPMLAMMGVLPQSHGQ